MQPILFYLVCLLACLFSGLIPALFRRFPPISPTASVVLGLLLTLLLGVALVRSAMRDFWPHYEDANVIEQWYISGQTAFEQHEWDVAIAAFEQVLVRQEDYKDAFQYRNDSWYFKGVDAYQSGNDAEARDILIPRADYRDARVFLQKMAAHQLNRDTRVEFLLYGPVTEVRAMSMSQDGRVLAVGGKTHFQVWSLFEHRLLFEAPLDSDWSGAIALNGDGTRVAVASDHVSIYDLQTGRELHRLEKLATDIAMSPDNQLLATSAIGEDVTIWRVQDGSQLRTIAHGSDMESLAFSPDGRLLATGGTDSLIHIWDVATGTQQQTLRGGNQKLSLTFSSDGKRIVSGENSFLGLHMWDVSSGQQLMHREGQGNILSVAFSPDGKLLMMGNEDSSVTIVRAQDFAVLTTLPAHGSAVIGAQMTPDQQRLVTVTRDGLIVVWDVHTILKAEKADFGGGFVPPNHSA